MDIEYIYIVAEHSPDVSSRFMDMRGAFKTQEEALKHREYIYERYKLRTEVMKFALLDTIGEDTIVEVLNANAD